MAILPTTVSNASSRLSEWVSHTKDVFADKRTLCVPRERSEEVLVSPALNKVDFLKTLIETMINWK